MNSSPAAFLSGSTDDALCVDKRAAEPPLLLVTDQLLHGGHQLLVLLGLDVQLLQPGQVLLEVLAAFLGNALLTPATLIVCHIEKRWKVNDVIIFRISKVCQRQYKREKAAQKEKVVHAESFSSRLRSEHLHAG